MTVPALRSWRRLFVNGEEQSIFDHSPALICWKAIHNDCWGCDGTEELPQCLKSTMMSCLEWFDLCAQWRMRIWQLQIEEKLSARSYFWYQRATSNCNGEGRRDLGDNSKLRYRAIWSKVELSEWIYSWRRWASVHALLRMMYPHNHRDDCKRRDVGDDVKGRDRECASVQMK